LESMPAPTAPVTVGVDTHLDLHVAAVLDHTGRLLATQAFPASTRGYVVLVTWAERFGPSNGSGSKAPAPTALGWPGSCAPTVWTLSRSTGLTAAFGGATASRIRLTPRPPPGRP
jgi:hypothetical protein